MEPAGGQTSPTVAADGRVAFPEGETFPLEVTVAEETFPLLVDEGHSHFRVLRSKLKWD